MKKIILFTDCLGAGGAQRQLVGLATMLNKRGYNVKVYTYFDNAFYKSTLDKNKIPNEIIPNAVSGITRILAVTMLFKKENPDWVIAYQETPSLVACAGKLLVRKYRLIVSERNTTQRIGMNERVRFFLYRWADAIVPNSYTQERWLKEHRSYLSNKITTITNFVDLESFVPIAHQRRKTPEVLVAASIWAPKNTLGLIRACRMLKNRNVKVHFSWYGKSESDLNIDYYNQCEALINEQGVGEYIDLLPKTKEIKAIYQNADYFCLPSFYEGTPNVLCEAISCGLPVMVSNVCDNSIYAQAGKNAVLFNPNSPEDMANKIQSMLEQCDEEYQSQRMASRAIAEEKLSSEAFVSKYIQILNN